MLEFLIPDNCFSYVKRVVNIRGVVHTEVNTAIFNIFAQPFKVIELFGEVIPKDVAG